MNAVKIYIPATLLVALVVVAYAYFSTPFLGEAQSFRECTITQSKVSIGHQSSTLVLTKGTRQWVVVQQPAHATNTVSISLNASSTAGSGYQLLGNASTSPDKLVFGHATDLPSSASVNAITNFGSTTVNVISCR